MFVYIYNKYKKIFNTIIGYKWDSGESLFDVLECLPLHFIMI